MQSRRASWHSVDQHDPDVRGEDHDCCHAEEIVDANPKVFSMSVSISGARVEMLILPKTQWLLVFAALYRFRPPPHPNRGEDRQETMHESRTNNNGS